MIRPKIGLDWDDVTAPFNSIACEFANKKYNISPKLTIDDVTWGNTGRDSVIKEFYSDIDLYNEQSKRISEKTKESIRDLMEIADVYFITAVAPEFMGVRAKQIQKTFPELSSEKIILGAAKHLVQFDIILDDNMCNVLNSPAKFPVLFRKPWNKSMTGLLSVNTMPEFLSLVEHILKVQTEKKETMSLPRVVVLVGPSGSGKNEVAKELVNNYPNYGRAKAYSTKKTDNHLHMDEEEFRKQDFFEKTMYAGYGYGTKKEDIESLLNAGKNVVIPLDMCGAISMKKEFRTSICYLKKDKVSLIKDILISKMTVDEQTLRLLSIEAEKKNAEICDYVIENKNVAETAKIISQLIKEETVK